MSVDSSSSSVVSNSGKAAGSAAAAGKAAGRIMEVDQTPVLVGILRKLTTETKQTKCFRSVIEIMLEIHRNVLFNPQEERFRNLNVASRRMQNLTQFENAVRFMEITGWKQGKERWTLGKGINLKQAVEVLQDFRLIPPSEDEWVASTKFECPAFDVDEYKKFQARQDAAAERQKELEEFYKDKEERRRLAEIVKQEHSLDTKWDRQEIPGRSRRTPLNQGASHAHSIPVHPTIAHTAKATVPSARCPPATSTGKGRGAPRVQQPRVPSTTSIESNKSAYSAVSAGSAKKPAASGDRFKTCFKSPSYQNTAI